MKKLTLTERRERVSAWMKKEKIQGKRMTQKRWDKLSKSQMLAYWKAAGVRIINLV